MATAIIDLTGMTPSPSPPQGSSCRASSSAAASSYLKRRDANAPSPYASSSSSTRKVIVYVYSSDDESEQVPPGSQGSNSGGIAARSSSSGGRFLEPDNDAVENEEEESILEFRSHLSRFAGPKAPPVKPAASASSSSSRRSRSPTKAGPSRAAAAGQTTARRSGAQAATKRSASPSRPVEGNVASSSKTSPTKKRAKRPPKAAAAASDAPSDGANTSPTKKSAAKPKPPPLPPPPPPLDLTPFPNSKLLLLTMCPLCSHPFPARQPAPTRRRHISLCGSSKTISASVALAVLDDEIRRLDRLAQIEEQEKQMHESCWDFLVRSSGLGVRRTQDEEMWDALGLPQGSARRTECRRREEEADALAGVELGVRNASAEALKSARRWKRLDEGSRVCLLERHAVGGRKRAHRCFVELCDGLYGGDEEDEEEEGDVYDVGFDEPRALSDRPSSSMLPPATQSIRHRASRLAIRKGRGPNAGYGLGLHLPSRPSSSGKGVAR